MGGVIGYGHDPRLYAGGDNALIGKCGKAQNAVRDNEQHGRQKHHDGNSRTAGDYGGVYGGSHAQTERGKVYCHKRTLRLVVEYLGFGQPDDYIYHGHDEDNGYEIQLEFERREHGDGIGNVPEQEAYHAPYAHEKGFLCVPEQAVHAQKQVAHNAEHAAQQYEQSVNADSRPIVKQSEYARRYKSQRSERFEG